MEVVGVVSNISVVESNRIVLSKVSLRGRVSKHKKEVEHNIKRHKTVV